MAGIIWSGPRNPTNQVATSLGIPRWRLWVALHEIKRRSKLGARDSVTTYDDGTVRDANGEHVGNIYEDSRAN
jgi:hypothetical protein